MDSDLVGIKQITFGSFAPYLSEDWDFDDPIIIDDIVVRLIEEDYLYLPYVDETYYTAA